MGLLDKAKYHYLAQENQNLKKTNVMLNDFLNYSNKRINNLIKKLQYRPESGLANKNLLERDLKEILTDVESKDENIALYFIKLDEHYDELFRTNEKVRADWILFESGQRIKSRNQKFQVYQTRDDEFAVIYPDKNIDENNATKIAKEIYESISQPYNFKGAKFDIGCNIGYSLYPKNVFNKEDLFKSSDVALSAALSFKKNYVQYEKSIKRKYVLKQELKKDMQSALEDYMNEQFYLNFQPIVQVDEINQDTIKYKICGAETLLRWKHPKRGNISPEEFIKIAEDTGLIYPLGLYTLYRLVDKLKTIEKTDFYTSINVSPKQFQDDDLVNSFKNISKNYDTHKIKIELTESSLFENMQDAKSKITSLHDLGFEFLVDDFGTGYSSLSNLSDNIPIKTLKIDKSFVRDADNDDRKKALLKGVISLGREMNYDLIAEGVETIGELEFLVEQGCTKIQGYYFYKPMMFDKLCEELLKSDLFYTRTRF